MIRGNFILFGYGISYIVITVLSLLEVLSISQIALLSLSIASFLFALADFFNIGGRLIVELFRRIYVYLLIKFNRKLIADLKKITDDIPTNIKKYNRKMPLAKRTINKANRIHSKIMKSHEKEERRRDTLISILLYIMATIALIISFASSLDLYLPDRFQEAFALLPMGILFINMFFESSRYDFTVLFTGSADRILREEINPEIGIIEERVNAWTSSQTASIIAN